jgi:hypothetical protein
MSVFYIKHLKKVLTVVLSLSFLNTVTVAQDKVGVTAVIANDADRNYGMGHAGNNAAYIQQLRNAVLPVSLMSFDLKVSTNSIKVEWKTASEKNSSHFILKRAGEDKIFVDVTQIQAAKESSKVTYYQYIDRFPLTGDNYYLLEQFDADGTKKLSRTIATTYNLKEQYVFAYFSEQGILNTQIHAPKQEEPVKIAVSNIQGQRLSLKSVNLQESNHVQFNDVFLGKGLYILTISFKNHVISQKIIK